MNTKFNSFSKMLEVLPDENSCREFLEHLRWDGEPVCPHCGLKDKSHYKLKTKGVFKGLYKCKACRERFSVTVKTMFEGSHISLRKWFIAMYIFSNHKKGISSLQLSRDIDVTQTTAWFMLSRIRNTFSTNSSIKFEGKTEVDESYIGGKEKNKSKSKRTEATQGRSTKTKTAVVGLVSNGTVKTKVVSDTKASTLKPIIQELVKEGSIVVTDEWTGYSGLSKTHHHEVIKHKLDEFVRDGYHTNSVEGFWSLLKRGIYGIYHSTSPKHLTKYLDEFTYRYNTRKISEGDRFSLSLKNANDRLTYKELTKKDIN